MIAPRPRPADARFRRVVVAFDGACDEDLAAVEAGAAFAARLHADLIGLFVEDIDLARLAEHPGVATFAARSAGRQQLAPNDLKTALRAQLARTRRAMERAAAGQRLQAAFEIRRGRVLAEIATAAAPADLVIIGWRGHFGSVTASGTPATDVLAAMRQGPTRFVLVPRPPASPVGPVIVAYDGSGDANGCLLAAAEVAAADGTLEIALLARRAEDVGALQREAGRVLTAIGRRAALVPLPGEGLEALLALGRRRGASLLVVPARLLDPRSARRLAEHAPCSMLLVREGGANG